MIMTSEMLEILEEAEEIAALIWQSELGKTYLRMYENLRNDTETQKKIAKFQKLKVQHEEVVRFGHFHPDYDKVLKEVRHLKRTLTMQENVIAFKKAEAELGCLLDEMARLIADAVSPKIKVPTSSPLFKTSQQECGGGNGCQCSD